MSMNHDFVGDGTFCRRMDNGPAGSSGLICGFGRLAHDIGRPGPLVLDVVRKTSPLDERRQRAREAAFHALNGPSTGDIEPAIETATRVRITSEIISAGYPTVAARYLTPEERLAAAFRAAGFEVEQ